MANPDMLTSGLTLVGRQFPVETGVVDLVGIDEDARGECGSPGRSQIPSDADHR